MKLQHQIRRLAFFRYLIGEGVTLSEATRQAARELAAEHKQRRKTDRPASRSNEHSGIRAALLRRLFGGLGHVREPPRRPHEHDPLAELADPVVAAPPVEVMKAEPEPMSGQVIGVFTGSSGAELIPETEFGPVMRSPVYQNWKSSIAENEKRRARMNGRWIG